jgi:hypothetical protein
MREIATADDTTPRLVGEQVPSRSTFLKKRLMSTVFDEVEVRISLSLAASRAEWGRAC